MTQRVPNSPADIDPAVTYTDPFGLGVDLTGEQLNALARNNHTAAFTAPKEPRSVRRQGVPRRTPRMPRPRGAGRPGRRLRHVARATSSSDPGDPDPDEEPAFEARRRGRPRVAPTPRPRPVYGHGLSKCPSCGTVLLWHDGKLICPSRACAGCS